MLSFSATNEQMPMKNTRASQVGLAITPLLPTQLRLPPRSQFQFPRWNLHAVSGPEAALRTHFPRRPAAFRLATSKRTSGVPGVMAGPSETKPPLFAAMFDRSSLNRARLCDHENLGRHLRFGADRHRRRNLFGPRADERNGTSCRP